MPFVAWLLSSP